MNIKNEFMSFSELIQNYISFHKLNIEPNIKETA